jgi:hypothetical protein
VKILLCLSFLLIGCANNKPEYPILHRYSIRYSVDLKQCPKDINWQDYLYNYSESHGPIFNPDEKKEYAKFRIK